MCIVAFALAAHPRWRLVVAANRDEYHTREAAPLERWEVGGIIAGRDLKGGGTWLGVHEAGRLVLITNYRVPGYPEENRPSRGGLVTGLLEGRDPLAVNIAPYNPFSLLFADASGGGLLLGNYPHDRRELLLPGVHGLSNGAFVPPWPKTRRLSSELAHWLEGDHASFAPLFSALRDESPHDSPGDGPEPQLSGIFIRDPLYGTRCSTVIAVDAEGAGQIVERRYDAGGNATGDTAIAFRWPST